MSAPSKSLLPQPFTFGGVAAFAHASFACLWLFQLAVALLAAGAVVFFFEIAWAPVIARTVALLPNEGEIRHAVLSWPANTPIRASRSSFLQITIDPTGVIESGEGADLRVEFGPRELRLRSFFGLLALDYPDGYVIGLNRPALEPWWGAWHLPVLAATAFGVVVGLWLAWTALGLVYLVPARLIAFYADREITWSGAWRLAAAALLPGGIFLSVALAAYAMHQIDLVHLIFAVALHFLVGWTYLLAAPFCLPTFRPKISSQAATKNPFRSVKSRSKNPFADPLRDSER